MSAPTPLTAIDALSVADYVTALNALTLSVSDRSMLQTHYSAPNRIITASQLSRGVGFSVYSAANLHYGGLAGRIADALNISPKSNLASIVTFHKPDGDWEWTLRPAFTEALEETAIVSASHSIPLPEEVPANTPLREGTTYSVTVNAFERNSTARSECLAHFGHACACCNMTFASQYGDAFSMFIHVHHLKPLSEVRGKYIVDPVNDLVPVCPNCHAVIHSRAPPFTVSDVQSMLASNRGA